MKHESRTENTREGVETCLYLKISTKGFYEEVTFEQRPERGKSISSADVLGREFQTDTTINPKALRSTHLVRPWNCKEAILDGEEL